MTVYKDIDMINTFISHIPKEWGLYIHIDRKSPIKETDIIRGNIYKKFKIFWGAREHLDSMLFLLNETEKDNIGYDYYHLVTGQDFFATNPQQFDEIIGPNGNIYMHTFSLPVPNWWNYKILHYATLASYCNVQRGVMRYVNMLYCNLQSFFGLKRKLPEYPIFGGILYCSLTQMAVKKVLYGSVAKDLYSRLKHSLCAEEIFFQTVLMNSDLKDKIINNSLRYMDWEDPSPPKVLAVSDYDRIIKSRTLFCRKIDSHKSAELLDKLSFPS